MKQIIIAISLFLSLSAWGQETAPEDAPEQAQPESAAAVIEEVKEIKYVTDKLRLSLYQSANSSSTTLKLLTSGDRLEVLERAGPYSRVRTADGTQGWVKNGFLVSDPTANLQLVEKDRQIEKLNSQLNKFGDTRQLVKDYENTIDEMKKIQQGTEQQLSTTGEQLRQQQQQTAVLQQQLEAREEQQSNIDWRNLLPVAKKFWYLLLLVLVLPLLIGFLVGRWMIEAQVRRRFQGVKVL